MNSPFADFIRGLLRDRTYAKEPFILSITTPADLVEFRKAMTHWTANPDPRYNGEIYEFTGDGIVYAIETTWLPQRFPNIHSEKWLTRLKHGLSNKYALAYFAFESGFLEFINYGREAQIELDKDPNPVTNCRIASMLEDAFEAFIGCLVTVIDKKYPEGIGYAVAYQFMMSYLNVLDISLDPKRLFDPVTRLKELYESKKYQLQWPIKYAYQTIHDPNGGVRVNVYGWPIGDRTPIPRNRVQLASVFSDRGLEVKSRHEAASIALEVLAKKYNIVEPVPDATEISLKKKWAPC